MSLIALTMETKKANSVEELRSVVEKLIEHVNELPEQEEVSLSIVETIGTLKDNVKELTQELRELQLKK